MGDVRGWAFGLLRMPRQEFYEMRIGEFWEALKAYRDEKDADRRHSGELARGMAIRLFDIQLRKEDRITDLRKFWRMPWDSDDKEDMELRRLNSLSEEERKEEVLLFYKRLENGKRTQTENSDRR